MEDKKMLNDSELDKVSGGVGSRVCIKDSSNTKATQSFCSGCSRVRKSGTYSGRGSECTCANGISGVWRE